MQVSTFSSVLTNKFHCMYVCTYVHIRDMENIIMVFPINIFLCLINRLYDKLNLHFYCVVRYWLLLVVL